MSNAVRYTPLGQSSLRQRVCSKQVIMMIIGVTGVAILAALLQVFLLPVVRAQSNNSSSSNTSAGADYTSPGVYPARMSQFVLSANY